MAVTKLTTDLDVIQTLAQKPNTADGLTYQQLQAKFDEAGNDIKTYINDTLTAEIDTLNSANVKLTGNQTVAGVKTFSSSPIVPAPTTDLQVTTKKYVDDLYKPISPNINIHSLLDYTDLADAIATIGTDNAVLYVPTKATAYDVSANVVIPSNIQLVFNIGGVLKPANGVSITGTNTSIQAGLYQIFDLSAVGTIAGTWSVTEVYPEWFGAVGDGVTDDLTAFNNCKNSFTQSATIGNVTIALQNKIYLLSDTFTIDRPNVALRGNAGIGNYDGYCLLGDHTNSVLTVSVASGKNGTFIYGISINGNSKATKGLYVASNEFATTLIENVSIKLINGVGLDIGENNYSTRYKNVISSSLDVGLSIVSKNNQHISFQGCQFSGGNDGAIIGTDSATDALRNTYFSNCEFYATEGNVLKIYNTLYNINFQNCWFEKISAGTLTDYLIVLGSASSTAKGVIFSSVFFQSNSKCEYVFHWSGAAGIIFSDLIITIASLTGFIQATGANVTEASSIMLSGGAIAASAAVTGKTISQLFRLWNGDSTLANSQFKTMLYVDPDGQPAAGGNAVVVKSKRNSEDYERFRLSETGVYYGGGAVATDVSLVRSAAARWGVVGDFNLAGAFDSGRLMLGAYYLWVDATGDLRIKSGAPTSDTDGTIVGTQS